MKGINYDLFIDIKFDARVSKDFNPEYANMSDFIETQRVLLSIEIRDFYEARKRQAEAELEKL